MWSAHKSNEYVLNACSSTAVGVESASSEDSYTHGVSYFRLWKCTGDGRTDCTTRTRWGAVTGSAHTHLLLIHYQHAQHVSCTVSATIHQWAQHTSLSVHCYTPVYAARMMYTVSTAIHQCAQCVSRITSTAISLLRSRVWTSGDWTRGSGSGQSTSKDEKVLRHLRERDRSPHRC